MAAGKKEAAVTAISLAAAKGFKKVNNLMNKATSYLKKATGEMASIKSATTSALANVKRRRELIDYENKYTK